MLVKELPGDGVRAYTHSASLQYIVNNFLQVRSVKSVSSALLTHCKAFHALINGSTHVIRVFNFVTTLSETCFFCYHLCAYSVINSYDILYVLGRALRRKSNTRSEIICSVSFPDDFRSTIHLQKTGSTGKHLNSI